MHPGPNARRGPTAPIAVALATAIFCLIAYRPAQLYFFGDTWDILSEFHANGWQTVWRMHNEHFMPVSKALLYLQYLLFHMNNLPYQWVNIAIHATNAALLYVLAGELTPLVIPRVLGALFFAFSGVYWEVTMWEAGQQTSLALLFILFSLICCGRYLRGGSVGWLACTALSALCASWSMGYGLLVIPLLIVQAITLAVRAQIWRRVAAICIFPAAAILLGLGVLIRSDPGGLHNAVNEASFHAALQTIPWTLAGLRGLGASYISPLCAPVLLGGMFLLAGLFFVRRIATINRILTLPMPASMLLLPYALTAVGRAQHSLTFAASSRYQYLPAAALGLILAWLAAGIFDVARGRARALLPLSVITLLTLPLHAMAGYVYLGRYSFMLNWGASARRFVGVAINRHNWADAPPGMLCVRPELFMPFGMYPIPFADFSRVLPLFPAAAALGEGRTLDIAAVFDRQELARANLLNSGQRGIHLGRWTSYGPAVASFRGGATRVDLRSVSAYSFETRCPKASHAYSFAASVRLVSGDPGASMRIVFKDTAGNLVDVVPARPIASHDFTVMAVSAYPPPNTAAVGVDFALSARPAVSSLIEIKDAVLFEHPLFIAESLLQKEVPDKHGIDPR